MISSAVISSALVLAAEWARRSEDDVIAVGLTVWLVAFVVGVVGVALISLADDSRASNRLVEERFASTLARTRQAAAASGRVPGWAGRDVDTGPAFVSQQPTYVPDAPAVGYAQVPPSAQESWEHLDDIRADLAGLSSTQMLPTVGGPDQPVRLR